MKVVMELALLVLVVFRVHIFHHLTVFLVQITASLAIAALIVFLATQDILFPQQALAHPALLKSMDVLIVLIVPIVLHANLENT